MAFWAPARRTLRAGGLAVTRWGAGKRPFLSGAEMVKDNFQAYSS